MDGPILLTGATGYIARHIAVQALTAGHAVRATVRRADRAGDLRDSLAPHVPPEALARLSTVVVDLDRDDGWDAALAGAGALMHTASPFPIKEPKDPEDLIRPAVEGTRRALRAARGAGVDRVILTSSVAAIAWDGREGMHTEADWTNPDLPGVSTYTRSKTLAERAAWDLARAEGLRLTTINPSLVVGPPIGRDYGSSVSLIARVLRGKDPALPKVGLDAVDVRDVAAMHLAALARPDTAGERFIASERFWWFPEIGQALKAAFPDRRIPTRTAPAALIAVLSLFDAEARAIRADIGKRRETTGDKARAQLGIAFRDTRDSMVETARALIASGAVK